MTLHAGDLPPRTTPTGTPYRVAVVCLGNICRSPMADVVVNDRLEAAGLDGRVEVVSAGTGGWHVGGPMDRRAAALLTTHGYDATRHRAQQFDAGWFDAVDLVLAMDADNFADIVAMGPSDRVRRNADDQVNAHAALVELLQTGDVEQAAAELERHLAHAETSMLDALDLT